jgi:hypothetical protein
VAWAVMVSVVSDGACTWTMRKPGKRKGTEMVDIVLCQAQQDELLLCPSQYNEQSTPCAGEPKPGDDHYARVQNLGRVRVVVT